MGAGGSTRKSKVSPVFSEKNDPKQLKFVWLLSASDDQLLQQTMYQLRVKFGAITSMSDATDCMSYIRSLSNYNVMLVVSSEFTSKILPEVCSLPQVVSFITFHSCNDQNPSAIPENNHVVSSTAQLIDIINDDVERIGAKDKSIKVTIYEETINRLLTSFVDIPVLGGFKKLWVISVEYSITLRGAKIKFLHNKMPEVCAILLCSVNGKEQEMHVRAELKFITDEQNNEIGMEIQKLYVTEKSSIKDINIKEYLGSLLKPIKFRGPMDMVSCLPIDIPDGKTKKRLHVRSYGLRYKIYDHYIVLSTNTEFTVDPGHKDH